MEVKLKKLWLYLKMFCSGAVVLTSVGMSLVFLHYSSGLV